MSGNNLQNIFVSIVILVIIVCLVWWLISQIPNPVIQQRVKIAGCIVFIFILLGWLVGGIPVYPFIR